MTEVEMGNLPPLMREIIVGDREIKSLRSEPVISLSKFVEASADTRRLRDAAAKLYGPRKGDNDGKLKG